MIRLLCLAAAFCASAHPAAAREIIVQSTTSTANSGLYDHILPLAERATGVTARVVAVGTGQALRNAANCDGDVLLVHSRAAEESFVAAGHGVSRMDLMYNDFVIVGPADDPAGISGGTDASGALAAIASAEAPFVSRGDDSGTHRKEMELWSEARADPSSASGGWYREVGSGMGAALNVAIGMGAYTITDRATWIGFANKRDFTVLVEGDEALFNQYGVVLVSPERCPNVDALAGRRFIDWLLSDAGQAAIAGHRIDDRQLFFPNAPR